MPQVDFYVLDSDRPGERERLACRIVEKAYGGGHRVYVLTDAAETATLDALLWTFRQGAFVPHAPAAERDGEPVAVGEGPPAPDDEVVVLLGGGLPDGWQDWKRIVEVVDRRPEVLRLTRERFRAYRAAGVEPRTHRLGSA